MSLLALPIGASKGGKSLSSGASSLNAAVKSLDEQSCFDWLPRKIEHWTILFSRFVVYTLPFKNADDANISGYLADDLRPSSFPFLEKFVRSVRIFMHPSNSGRWTRNLSLFMRHFTATFHRRYDMEMYHESVYSPSFNLSPPTVDSTVTLMSPLILMALYGKDESSSACGRLSLSHLAAMRPELVVLPLMETVNGGLSDVLEPHRVNASISAVSSIALLLLKVST